MKRSFDSSLSALILAAFAVFAYAAHTYFFEMDLVVAWRGFSVVDFANSVLYPENFTRDYPGGAAFIGNSSIVWLYPSLSKLLGVAPYTILLSVIAVEVIAIVLAIVLLLRTFVPGTPAVSYVLLGVLFLGSSARQIDLANFASIFLAGQFYVFADMLRIGALCAFLTKRYALCAGLLMVGFTVHPTMTALTLPVLFAALLASGGELRRPSPWLAAGAVVAFGAVWFTIFISQRALAAKHMSGPDFFEYSRLFNYHWYIDDLGFVLERPDRLLLPFMALALVGLEAVRRTPELTAERRAQMLAVLVMICVISVFGLVAAHNHWNEALIKASPQRISSFVGILFVPVIVHRLFRDVLSGDYGSALMGGAFLGTAVVQIAPYSIALAAVYIAPAIAAFARRRARRSYEAVITLGALAPVALLGLHWAAGFQLPLAGYFGTGWLFPLALAGLI